MRISLNRFDKSRIGGQGSYRNVFLQFKLRTVCCKTYVCCVHGLDITFDNIERM